MDRSKPFLEQAASEFNMMELMNLMGGHFKQVKEFNTRSIKFIRSIMKDNGDTKESREDLAARAMQTIREVVHLPEKSRDSIYEGFDPVLILVEGIESQLLGMIGKIIDHTGDNESYFDMLKYESKQIIGKIVEELEEGFIEGLNDVLPFLKANFTPLIKAGCDPSKAAIAGVMATPPIMKYIETAYGDYKKEKEESQSMKVD